MPDRRGIVTGDHLARKRVQAKHLRHTMAPAEQTLWRHLRSNRLGGHAFRRQQVIDGYIVDFYCHAAALVVEVDGDVHAFHRDADQVRQQVLERRGLHVLRCTNRDIVSHLRSVLEQILHLADRRAAELTARDDGGPPLPADACVRRGRGRAEGAGVGRRPMTSAPREQRQE